MSNKRLTPQERARKYRLNEYDRLFKQLIKIQRDIEISFQSMQGFDMDQIDSKVYNGLGSASYGLQAVLFCIRECQLADESKLAVESEVSEK